MSLDSDPREPGGDRDYELRLPLLGREAGEKLKLPRYILPVAGILLLVVLALAFMLLDPLSSASGVTDTVLPPGGG